MNSICSCFEPFEAGAVYKAMQRDRNASIPLRRVVVKEKQRREQERREKERKKKRKQKYLEEERLATAVKDS